MAPRIQSFIKILDDCLVSEISTKA